MYAWRQRNRALRRRTWPEVPGLDLPPLESRRDVRVVPFASPWAGGADPDASPVHAGVLRGTENLARFEPGWREVDAQQRPGRFLYGGPLKDHFGHVMIDAVPRLWGYRQGHHDGVVFPVVGHFPATLPDWMAAILGQLGVPQQAVQLVRAPTVFEQLDFAPPGSILRVGPQRWYLDWLQTRRKVGDRVDGRKLYYGRTHMLAMGSVMGESYFSRAMQDNGFQYVVPELLSIDEQLELVAAAGTIVFLEGSSIYITELLARIGAEVFMIPRRDQGHTLFGPQLQPRARRFATLPASVVRMENLGGRVKPDSPSYVLDPGVLFAAMRSSGLVAGDFDGSAFTSAENSDAGAYFGDDPGAASLQLARVRSLRRGAAAQAGSLPPA